MYISPRMYNIVRTVLSIYIWMHTMPFSMLSTLMAGPEAPPPAPLAWVNKRLSLQQPRKGQHQSLTWALIHHNLRNCPLHTHLGTLNLAVEPDVPILETMPRHLPCSKARQHQC